MPLKACPLFAGEPVETKRAEALAALDQEVSRLSLACLDDPATPAILADRVIPRPPKLGGQIRFQVFEAELPERDAGSRGRQGWGMLVHLIVPYSGPRDFFTLRAGAVPARPPRAVLRNRALILSASALTGNAEGLIDALDDQLETVRRELEDQRSRCEAMRETLVERARHAVDERKRRLEVLRAASRAMTGRGWRPQGSR